MGEWVITAPPVLTRRGIEATMTRKQHQALDWNYKVCPLCYDVPAVGAAYAVCQNCKRPAHARCLVRWERAQFQWRYSGKTEDPWWCPMCHKDSLWD